MRELTQRIHGCKPTIVRATRLTELVRDRTGRFSARGVLLTGPDFPVPKHAQPRANAANAMTQARMLRVVSSSPVLAERDWALLLENDAALHPRARALAPAELARVIRWATGVAEQRGFNMVHFALCPFSTQPYKCRRVQADGAQPGWPSLHACTGDARCATAYALPKARAREVAAAWDARNKGVRTCPRHVWGGPACPRDPWLLSEHLGECAAARPGLVCRSLIVGYDWAGQPGAQRGVFVQDRGSFGSTIDSKKSPDGRLVNVPP